jgi:Pectate lyase superfamily protein
MRAQPKLPLAILLSITLSACGSGSSENSNAAEAGAATIANPINDTIPEISEEATVKSNEDIADAGNNVTTDKSLDGATDLDGDGILDADDLWPTDPTKPRVSSLWGNYGEQWDKDPSVAGIQSRLPFYGLAGYRDGIEPPSPNCTLDVADFGASPNDNIDDTHAFWAALNEARKTASADNFVVICLGRGTYDLSKQLHLSHSGIVLRGAGRQETVLNFEQGMIDQTYPEFIGNVTNNWNGNKAIVLGNKGFDWSDALYLNELSDLSLLPKQGDLEITLPKALSASQLDDLEQNGYRIRLMQSTHYSNREEEIKSPIFTAGVFGGPEAALRVADRIYNDTFIDKYNEFTPMKFLSGFDTYVEGNHDEYKYANGHETLFQQFVVKYEPGATTMALDRPLRFDMTAEHLAKRPKLQLINSSKPADTDIGIENLTIQFPPTPWGDCSGELIAYACNSGLAGHSGYWAQGGIDVLSDYSWVRHVKFQNAGNPLRLSGDFNTAQGLIIDSNRPTTEGTSSAESPTDPNPYKKQSIVGHVGIKAGGSDNLVDDVIIRANFHHSLSTAHSQGVVLSSIRAEQPESHPLDSTNREYVKINMDHHRQIIHATLWTDIHIGGSYRMWESTGGITEGFNAAALNTYWAIDSSSPSVDYWPHNRKGGVEWGYHYINIVGTHIQQKPPVPQHADLSEQPYPYENKNSEMNPFPYHPDNAHLESIDPSHIWPNNLYVAQRTAYLECKLSIKPADCH